jgi:hypothetical protein
MSDLFQALDRHFKEERAIGLAWRWFRQSQQPVITLSAFLARVRAYFPEADERYVRSELERRVSCSRQRLRP